MSRSPEMQKGRSFSPERVFSPSKRNSPDQSVSQIYSKNGISVKMIHSQRRSIQNNPIVSRILKSVARKYEEQFGRQGPVDRVRSATTTQGAPYSSSDLIGSYSNESPSNNRLSSNDDLRHGNGSQSDRHDRRVVANRSRKDSGEGGRPSSRKQSKNGTNVSSGKASQDREREKDREQDARDRHKEIEGGGGGGASTTVLPPANAKTQHTNYSSFRPMNARNNFLGGQQINPLPSQKTQQSSNTSSSNSRESDDMVAMGTNPLTSRFRPRESSFVNGGGVYLTQSSSNTAAMARKFPKTNGFTPTRVRDSDPKYADPLSGAPPSFQQRLAEITSLEQETIRYERTKKFKKKKET